MSTPTRFRDRRHAETVAEIKATALRRYAETGGDGLALRGIARDMGLSAQALYHYFRDRDHLLTALITDGYHDVADAVAGGREAAGPDRRARMVGAALAYRRWAVERPSVFRLLYSDVIPGYRAPADGSTSGLGRRLGYELARACLPVTAPDPSAAATVSGQRPDAPWLHAFEDMAPALRGSLAQWWAQLHGLIGLEVLGHLDWTALDPAEVYRAAVEDLADRIEVVLGPG